MIKYLTLLDSLGRVLPPDDAFADNLTDEIAYLGIEGPPSVYAIVSKKMVENGGQMVVGQDVLLWDDNIGGAVDLDTRFTSEPGPDDAVTCIVWDEDDGWVQLADDEDDEDNMV